MSRRRSGRCSTLWWKRRCRFCGRTVGWNVWEYRKRSNRTPVFYPQGLGRERGFFLPPNPTLRCVSCGAQLAPGSDAVKELYKLIDYLPPKSIGTMIGQFAQVSREKNRQADSFFSAFANFYKRIREVENSVTSKTNAMTELYNTQGTQPVDA